MDAVIGRRGRSAARTTIIAIVLAVIAGFVGTSPASAAEDPGDMIEWTTSVTEEQTVTVNETATFEGYQGAGTATATKSATGTGTARETTFWEVYYWAIVRAQADAIEKARAAADAEARPIAKARALADAKAKAAAGPVMIDWSTSVTEEQTVTVHETATFEGYQGHGSATATRSATATGSASAPTFWEVYYWAIVRAQASAIEQARAAADAEARPIAKARALADAKAKAAAGPVMVDYSATVTQEETVTVDETATFEGYEGHGTATATASATATGTALEATQWEAYYWAITRAQTAASEQARAAADAEARPIAKARAVADAKAKAAAGPVMIDYTTSATRTETVTVTETATVNGYEGYGTATATVTATATGTASEATNWEAYYWATTRAEENAAEKASTEADAEARRIALERAQADAQAQADAAASPTDPGNDPTAPSCGQAVTKADGTPWVCTFADEFRGSEIDSSKWEPVRTDTSHFSYGDCFLGLGANTRVVDGSLHLTTRKESSPVTCQLGDKTVTSSYTSGAVTSLSNFSQTYGRVEIRAAMPATDGPGLQSALWMVPDDPTFYGGWPHSGEIDIAEFFSNYADRVVPTLHYDSALGFDQRTNNACLVFRPTDFHTYGLVWTPQRITITVDGRTCLDHQISPLAPLTGGAPFDRPFNLNLTQMLGSGANALPAGKDISEATLKVDYVRMWS